MSISLIFFTLFKHISDAKKLARFKQSAGKAQEVDSAVCGEDGLDYEAVKVSVLNAYDLVPEAYRQKFRNWVKGDKQINMEFVHDFASHFMVDVQLQKLILLTVFEN